MKEGIFSRNFMVLANKKRSYIFKYGKLWYQFVDLSSLIKNIYKYSILVLEKKAQN